MKSTLTRTALALLASLAEGARVVERWLNAAACELIAADLAWTNADGRLAITPAGLAWLSRRAAVDAEIGAFRAQHLHLAHRVVATDRGTIDVLVDEAESPIAWLARRKGRDGEPLIRPVQFQAGERLRGDFTRAQMTPRVTSNWDAAVAQGRREGGSPASFTDAVIASRERLRRALDAVGPEFAGLLLDVCCFLKGVEDVERERRWPLRSAKVVLQLGLDRLARHYGLGDEAQGKAQVPLRTWLDADSMFSVES